MTLKKNAKPSKTKKNTSKNLIEHEQVETEKKLFCVGIGASAGGLEALKELVTKLPETPDNVTYIVAQHLSPTHQSMMVQLIGRATELSVQEVEDGSTPQANVIYITPENNDVYIENGVLRLRSPQSEYGPKPSVDYFFSTLADDFGDHAIGVILSGTGSDGSHGMRAIRAAGGLTIVQDPSTAKYNGMPANAIETGCVDLVLTAEKIGPEIQRLVSSPRELTLVGTKEAEHSNIEKLLMLLKQRSGVDFKDYKSGTLFRRINRRLVATNTFSIEKYLKYIDRQASELDELFQDIMITVTNFFRDLESFERLRGYVREIIKSKAQDEPIRIWIPGCATGEEAYSVTIMFAEELGGIEKLKQYNFQVFATDIDNEALTRARRGIYPEATLENVHASIREQYFRASEKGFEILKSVREMVIFSRHNVFDDPPFLRQDLISCRNLLIYFNNSLQQHVLNLFHYALNPKGVLFLGKSEALGQSANLFQSVDSKNKIFQRKLVTSEVRDRLIRSPNYSSSGKVPVTATIQSNNKTLHELPDAYIQALAPDSLLIDESLEVVRIYGQVQPYTQLAPGSASMNLMSLTRKEFRQELRAMTYKLLREQGAPNLLTKRMNIDGEEKLVHIKSYVLKLQSSPERLVLISFQQKKAEELYEENTSTSDDKPIVRELEQELATTREHLQTVVEELETSNEELQSTNEELQSSNEELQSSNEELETANEELQSTNEELLTVNEELQVKSAELNATNEDLENIKESIDFPLLVVDKELRITRYNRAAKQIFLLQDGDNMSQGEALTSIATLIEIPDLRQYTLDVIRTGVVETRSIEGKNKSFVERIVPYVDENKQIKGAVLTYIDNTEENELSNQLKYSEERYRLATKGANAGIWDWHVGKDIFYCSPILLQMLRLPENSMNEEASFNFLKHRIHPEDRQDVLSILDAHLERGFEFNVECRLKRSSGDYIWVHIRGQAEWGPHNKPKRMAGSIYDITERQQAIEDLTKSNESLERFAYICSHDLKEPARIVENFVRLFHKQYREDLDDRAQEYLEHIKGSAGRMQEMIQDILKYSQIEHKNTNYEEINCHLELEKVLQHLELTITEYKADITIQTLPIIRADRMQLFQVFLNLISNALKFNNKKKIKVIVGAEEQKDHWKFFVKDNGIGMEPEHAAQVFQVFKRLNNTEQFSGTGIGLSICQRVVEKHNGKIWVEAKPGKGATFYFTIPKKHKRGIYIHDGERAAATG